MAIEQPRRTKVTAMSDKTFNTLRWIAQILLPGLGAFYFAMAGIWDWAYAEQVIGSLAALDVLLGVLLGYSRKQYEQSEQLYDGNLVITPRTDDADLYSIELSTPIGEIAGKSTLALKVDNRPLDSEAPEDNISQ